MVRAHSKELSEQAGDCQNIQNNSVESRNSNGKKLDQSPSSWAITEPTLIANKIA